MTLNLAVTTHRCIYQSADYRLRDVRKGDTRDFETQKIVLVNTFGWSATVCFAGVGRTQNLDVSEWLADRVGSIQPDDPFERLLDELLTANEWLSTVSKPHDNRHSFSVGAFVGSEPVFALVSNFEQPSGPAAATASSGRSSFLPYMLVVPSRNHVSILNTHPAGRKITLGAPQPGPVSRLRKVRPNIGATPTSTALHDAGH
jgi:hypothetical protein